MNVTLQSQNSELMQTMSMKLLTDGIQEYYDHYGRLPTCLADVGKSYNTRQTTSPNIPWEELMKDASGKPYHYERLSATTYRLTSWQEITVRQK